MLKMHYIEVSCQRASSWHPVTSSITTLDAS